jgi:hypothetical protein
MSIDAAGIVIGWMTVVIVSGASASSDPVPSGAGDVKDTARHVFPERVP